MSEGAWRVLSLRKLDQMRALHGDGHSASLAALGRVFAWWGAERVRPPLKTTQKEPFQVAYTRVNQPGYRNRRWRRWLKGQGAR